MKIFERRLPANRANAAHSPGPITSEPITRTRRQSLLAKQILIGTESAGNFHALCDILLQRFAPVDDFEYGFIEELASAYWRL